MHDSVAVPRSCTLPVWWIGHVAAHRELQADEVLHWAQAADFIHDAAARLAAVASGHDALRSRFRASLYLATILGAGLGLASCFGTTLVGWSVPFVTLPWYAQVSASLSRTSPGLSGLSGLAAFFAPPVLQMIICIGLLVPLAVGLVGLTAPAIYSLRNRSGANSHTAVRWQTRTWK